MTEEPAADDLPRVDAAAVIAALASLGINGRRCPQCDTEGRTGFGGTMMLPSTGTAVIPVITVVCQHCGFMRHFDRTVLKL